MYIPKAQPIHACKLSKTVTNQNMVALESASCLCRAPHTRAPRIHGQWASYCNLMSLRHLRSMDTFIKYVLAACSNPSFYSGQPALNRLSFQRPHASKLNAYLTDARFLVFRFGQPLVHKDKPGSPYYLTPAQVSSLVGSGYSHGDAKPLESRREADSPTLIFMGVDESGSQVKDIENPTGTAYFAVDATQQKGEDVRGYQTNGWAPPEDSEFVDARLAGSSMSPYDAGLFAAARPLIDWNGRNVFCPACGGKTYSLWGGWKRNCQTAMKEEDKSKCFANTGLHNFAHPRTDAVTIMGIIDETGDKMLLGRNKNWPKGECGVDVSLTAGMYSCLAGFLEPGESFEEAVRREVMEEAGIIVGPVRYASSQPWPYPANLMIGCYGRAKEGQKIRLDLDNELQDAQWFPRAYVAKLAMSKDGSTFSKDDYKQLDKAINGEYATDDEERFDRYEVFTKMPPTTAIAGVLMRNWALGAHAVDLVSRM